MKKSKLILISVITVGMFSAFTIYNETKMQRDITQDGNYELTAVNDLSIEQRIISHSPEISSLENYFTTVQPDLSVINDYNSTVQKFEIDIVSQYNYMAENNIRFEDLRTDPTILPNIYSFTSEDLLKINVVLNKTIDVASPQLVESAEILKEYINAVDQITYTPLEIFSDATGFESPSEYAENSQSNQRGAFAKSLVKGLQFKEALRKIKDIAKHSSVKNPLRIYPNPINDISSISFFNPVKGEVSIQVLNISGQVIKSKSIEVNKGESNLKLINIFPYEKHSKGLYILRIQRLIGEPITQKLII